MPELPEMETYKFFLSQLIGGQTITGVTINREKSINVSSSQFTEEVLNDRIKTIERRAKYLIFHLQNGSYLLLHLMLGGWMFYGNEQVRPNRTIQVMLSFGNTHLYFIGLRLGYLHLETEDSIKSKFDNLGPEPLEPGFSLDTFLDRLSGKRGALKTTLMNQEFIAGIGNRYSDEILWHAQLRPDKKASEIDRNEKIRLYESIKFILQQAIQNGGYMDPLFIGDTKTGGYQMYVHGQAGKACPRCNASIMKKEMSSRKTYYCDNCQY